MVNLIVSGVPAAGRSVVRCFQMNDTPCISANCVAAALSSAISLPRSCFVLISRGHVVSDDDLIAERGDESAFMEMRICRALPGGKGGFGANLRGGNAANKTTNFGACRDLSGRRLRDVREERALPDENARARADVAKGAVSAGESGERFVEAAEAGDDVECLKDEVDIEGLKDDMKACKEVVEDDVAQGIRASCQLRKQIKKVKSGKRNSRKRRHLDSETAQVSPSKISKLTSPAESV